MVSALFTRQQLEYLQQEVVRQDFPELLMASGAAVNVSNEVPAGAETYSYEILTAVGTAAVLANGATDIPMVNAYAEKRVGFVRTIANGYELTVEDLEAAEYAGKNVNTEMAIAAREVMERKVDLLYYNGDSNYNLLGFLGYPNVPSYTILNDGAQNGGTDSTQWQHKTAEQIYRDLREFATATRTATNGVENPEVIALPQAQFDQVMQTPYPTNSASGETIGSFFLKAQRMSPSGVQSIIPMPYLAGQGTGGADMMVSYRKRPDKVKAHMPLDFEQRAPQERDLSYRTICRMRVGGIQVTKPLSMRYAEGI